MPEFAEWTDLAAERLGGAALLANDEFFAGKDNLLSPRKPVWIEGKYTPQGKWMDGWETRRRRTPGYDWCVVRLGLPGVVRGVLVDTAFFKGNFPEACSLDACAVGGAPTAEELVGPAVRWVEILPRSALKGDSENWFAVGAAGRFSHVRLNIFPDGGVARLRVFGEPLPEPRALARPELDLSLVENGGRVLGSSDDFFGSRGNLILPGPALNMGDGWETRRRRGPGHDWILVQLAGQGLVRRVEVDTTHFRGNAPGACVLEVCDGPPEDDRAWRELLPQTRLQPHTRHVFEDELAEVGPATHARLSIFPDGGVGRLRLWGALTAEGRAGAGLRWLNALPGDDAQAALRRCCGSTEWAQAMAAARPFADGAALRATAARLWQGLGAKDWREAFAAHPRIGEQKGGAWSKGEQAGVGGQAVAALAEANRAYEARFGHIFIICATGRSGEEMLAACRERLGNDAEGELRVAAEEQRKITELRLDKLLRGEQ